jgi:thiamine biosynthesis lipoprotein
MGEGPDEGGWTIAIEHPDASRPIALVGVRDGAVATSTTLLRRWSVDGEVRHHVIDPGTGRPSHTDLTLAAVVASEAWLAEVLATALLVRGSRHSFGLIGGSGAEGLVVDRTGQVECSPGFSSYTGGSAVERIVEMAS